MASLIPLDGDMWSRLRAEKQTKERIPYVDKTPTLGQMMAIGQTGAQALGGLGNMIIQGVGSHQAQSAWDEANQKYRSEQEAKQQADLTSQQATANAERPAYTQQAIRSGEEQAAMMGQTPWSMATPAGTERAVQDGSAPQQTVGQMIAAPRIQREAPPMIAGNESQMIPPTFAPLYQTPHLAPAAQSAQPQSRTELSAPPVDQFPQQPFTQQTRDLPYRQFADQKRAPIADLPTVGELRNMAFMAGQGNDPQAKQKVIDMMNRMPGAFGGPQNLTDVLTGGHEERGQQSVYDLMRQGHGKSPLEMALDQERINNYLSQEGARKGDQKRKDELHGGMLRKQELDQDLATGKIDKAKYDTKRAMLLADFEPERQDELVKLWQSQGTQAIASAKRAGAEAGVAKQKANAMSTQAAAAWDRAKTARNEYDLHKGIEGYLEQYQIRLKPQPGDAPDVSQVKQMGAKALDTFAKLTLARAKAGLKPRSQDELMNQGFVDAADSVALKDQTTNREAKAEVQALSNELETLSKNIKSRGGNPLNFGANLDDDNNEPIK